MSKAQEARTLRAEKALINSMSGRPARLVPGSVEVHGGSLVSWTEACRTSESRSGAGECHHARYGSASRDALDAFFKVVEASS